MVNETRQRMIVADRFSDQLFILTTGESFETNGLLSIINRNELKEIRTLKIAPEPIDIAFDEEAIYVLSIGQNLIEKFSRQDYSCKQIKTFFRPVKILSIEKDQLAVLSQDENCLQIITGDNTEQFPIPFKGLPDNFEMLDQQNLLITSYSFDKAWIICFNLKNKEFKKNFDYSMHFGPTELSINLNSFFNFGQFADNRLRLSVIKKLSSEEWGISDLLSGKIVIISLR